MKLRIKKSLAAVGLYHPSLGIKIHPPKKAEMLLAHKGARNIFVETGTETGDMIERMRPHFKKIYSIELDPTWHEKAKVRFASAPEVSLIYGDSGEAIRSVLSELTDPTLFWLDAHASGHIYVEGPQAAPVARELSAIMAHPVRGHAILIDDARHFDRRGIRALKRLAREANYSFSIENGLFILERTSARTS